MQLRLTRNSTDSFDEILEIVDGCRELLEGLMLLDSEPNLDVRRGKAVEFLCQFLDADFGFWSWGRGHPETDERVVPIAMIPWGMESLQVQEFFQVGMSNDSDKWHRAPFLPLLRNQSQVCRSRPHFWTTEQWTTCDFRNAVTQAFRLDEWMICVRYPSQQIWSCISLMRRVGKPSFTPLECGLLDLACATVRWLQSQPLKTESMPSHAGLSLRNTEVLFLLLDGRSRKEIATALGVTTHIINDCIKQIYTHFGATSATELAAIFLRRV
ncbi:MAG: helix-turn-helix transcriptional regulator [Pirellula sp.]|jgi:DNA-binding CsgD family transcriptional regulator|nr:helix-turn-helix transcriptional regulator [Pirellula sp.]